MLDDLIHDGIALGIAQAGAATLLALAALWVARRWRIHLERETLVALARGLVQIVAVGAVLVLLLEGPDWTSGLVLLAMMGTAAGIAGRRAGGIPEARRVCFYAIAFGAGVVILLMTAAGVIDTAITALVPVGSMIIASAMNTTALALERFRSDVEAHAGRVEAGLSLGAAPETAVAPYVEAAVAASLIPRIDTLRSLGIVWIPGLMTGMLLAGADPIYAALYQFVVVGMIYASSGLSSVASTLLIRRHAFTEAAQLRLRPEGGAA